VIPEITSLQLLLESKTLLGGDVTGDGHINILDIAYVGARFGGVEPSADITGDGVVDILDLVLTASNFGQSSSSP
jgi:hypothetical protein